jgi:quinol monooxygenase YgiN
MSLPVLIGFAGVLVAAVATGMLAGRCVRQPRMDFILWTAATLQLTVALAAESLGFASGFGATTFRAVQLFALLLAPLWLAWGLVELVAGSEAARFGMRLVASALTVVASVILTTDPLTAQPFSKSFPQAGPHFQPVSHYALDVVQVVAVVAAVVSTGLAAVRSGKDPRWRSALTGIAPIGLAVLMTAGQRFSLPDKSGYPVLALLAAVLVWFGATRVQPVTARDGGDRRASGPDDDFWPGDGGESGADGVPGAQYATYGHQRPGGPYRGADALDHASRVSAGTRPPARERLEEHRRPGPFDPAGPFDAAGNVGPAGPAAPPADERRQRPQDPRMAQSPGPEAVAMTGAAPGFGTPAQATGSPAAAPARPYGRILIFTLLEDRVADFDRLAEQTAEEVMTREPGTLVYVIHLVPNAPMQRIFYEIYRDRAAFDRHESQPYMQRFVVDRRSCVLATNVIELRLKYAKIAPLPNPEPASAALPPGPRAQLPPGLPPGPQGTPPAMPEGMPPGMPQGMPPEMQRLEPLPAGPPQGARRPAARPYGGT